MDSRTFTFLGTLLFAVTTGCAAETETPTTTEDQSRRTESLSVVADDGLDSPASRADLSRTLAPISPLEQDRGIDEQKATRNLPMPTGKILEPTPRDAVKK
jgi:hypothetical protein